MNIILASGDGELNMWTTCKEDAAYGYYKIEYKYGCRKIDKTM